MMSILSMRKIQDRRTSTAAERSAQLAAEAIAQAKDAAA
jgi:hypothetical protein